MSTDIKSLDKELAVLIKDMNEAEGKMKGWEADLKIDGKNLEVACVEHASLLGYYDEIAVGLKYTLEYAEMIEKRVRGEIYTHCKESFKKEYSDTGIKQVIESNPLYLKVHEVYIAVEDTYARCRSIVESFRQRSFDLNNIIKIRENALHEVTIRI